MIDSPVELSNRVVRLLKTASFDWALIGSRRMRCERRTSDWDFAAVDTPEARQWLQTTGFHVLEDYHGPVVAPHRELDLNTSGIWERWILGWKWQSGKSFVPGTMIHVMLVKDLHLCTVAYDFVARDPVLLKNRHATPTWNRVYQFLLLGNPLVPV